MVRFDFPGKVNGSRKNKLFQIALWKPKGYTKRLKSCIEEMLYTLYTTGQPRLQG